MNIIEYTSDHDEKCDCDKCCNIFPHNDRSLPCTIYYSKPSARVVVISGHANKNSINFSTHSEFNMEYVDDTNENLNTSMQIFIKHDKTYTITCSRMDTVAQIKEQFCQKMQFRDVSVKLTYGGKLLDNNRTLVSYNIQKLSTLFAQFRFVD